MGELSKLKMAKMHKIVDLLAGSFQELMFLEQPTLEASKVGALEPLIIDENQDEEKTIFETTCYGCAKEFLKYVDDMIFTIALDRTTSIFSWWKKLHVTGNGHQDVTFYVCGTCFQNLYRVRFMNELNRKVSYALAQRCAKNSPFFSILPFELLALVFKYSATVRYHHYTREPLPMQIKSFSNLGIRPDSCCGGAWSGVKAEEEYDETNTFLDEHKDGLYRFYKAKEFDGRRDRQQPTLYTLVTEAYNICSFTCSVCSKTYRIPRCNSKHHGQSPILPISFGKILLVDTYWEANPVKEVKDLEFKAGTRMIFENGNLCGVYWVSDTAQRLIGDVEDYICGICLRDLEEKNLIVCDGLH